MRHGDLLGAVVTRTLTTTQGGESTTQVVTDHYDTRGRLVLQDVVGTDASGGVVLREQSTSEYDAKGQLVHEATVSDYDGDGPGAPITNAVDTTFDAAGFVVRKVATVDYESDGVPEQRQVVSFDNDRKGRAVSTKVANDFDGDGVDDVEIFGGRLRRQGQRAAEHEHLLRPGRCLLHRGAGRHLQRPRAAGHVDLLHVRS
jgi:hypothetical protein